jgi:uncharacterized membrane protein
MVRVGRFGFTPRTLLLAAVGAHAAGYASLSILHHRAFNTGRFDLGNMVQAVWATAHGDFLRVTDLHGEQISRLGVHFDPILAAFAPLWLVWPSPDVLLTAQAIAIALGAFPVFWLGRKHLGSERAALGFALAYLLYPATQWLVLNEFHPVALACPLLLFAVWYLDEDRLLPFAAFALLAVTTKEQVPLVVAGFGLWYAVSRRRWWVGGTIAAAGIATALVALEVIVPHFNPQGHSSFYGRYREVGGSPEGLVRTLFTDPLRVLAEASSERDLHYLLRLLVPLAGLCFLAPMMLVAVLPELATNLLSATKTQTSIHFHYTAAEIPVLFSAAVLGAARIVKRRPELAVTIGVVATAFALAASYKIGAMPLWRELPGGERLQARDSFISRHDRIASKAIRLVPRGAVVSASNSLGAHLSARRRILSFPLLADATWVAIDEIRPSFADRNEPVRAVERLKLLRRNRAWQLVFERDGILIFRRSDRSTPAQLGSAGTPRGQRQATAPADHPRQPRAAAPRSRTRRSATG